VTTLDTARTFALGDRIVNRMGYGAMQLTGPGIFGPPTDRTMAISVLRSAVQQHSGWGAKIIDRLAGDLRGAYPDMKGFSPRNLKYMRAFSAAWPDRAIVQGPLARITWDTACLHPLIVGACR
jgi:uncharacterized protein DUF1016